MAGLAFVSRTMFSRAASTMGSCRMRQPQRAMISRWSTSALRPAAAAAAGQWQPLPLTSIGQSRSMSGAKNFEAPGMVEEEELRKVYAALVLDEPGVLSRISGMFSARGFNIESLVVGRTNMSHVSRMTVVATGSLHQLEMIRKELQALVQVVEVVELSDGSYVQCDLMLVKVSTKGPAAAQKATSDLDDKAVVTITKALVAGSRRQIIEISNLFDGMVSDVSEEEIMIQLSGLPERLDQFVKMVTPYGITELHRTGTIALGKCGSVDDAHMINSDQKGHLPTGPKKKMKLDASQLPPS